MALKTMPATKKLSCDSIYNEVSYKPAGLAVQSPKSVSLVRSQQDADTFNSPRGY